MEKVVLVQGFGGANLEIRELNNRHSGAEKQKAIKDYQDYLDGVWETITGSEIKITTIYIIESSENFKSIVGCWEQKYGTNHGYKFENVDVEVKQGDTLRTIKNLVSVPEFEFAVTDLPRKIRMEIEQFARLKKPKQVIGIAREDDLCEPKTKDLMKQTALGFDNLRKYLFSKTTVRIINIWLVLTKK